MTCVHRFSSSRSLTRLRAAAGLHLIFPLLWVALAVFLVRGFFLGHQPSLYWALGVIGGLCFLGVVGFAMSGSIRCPLCQVRLFRRSGATMNSRHRKSIFGSTRLYLALRVSFTRFFRCPYCGEPCETSEPRRK